MRHPELCLYDVADRVATITFNRPDRMNAMTGNMEVAYYDRLVQAQADDDVAAIVVTGAGKGWCPGADLAYRPGPDDEPLPNKSVPTTLPLTVTKPMVAAINGAVAGMALGLAFQCDFRIAREGAKFTTSFASRGLIAEYGMAWHLTHLANRAVALDLLLTGRVVLAEEMLQLGLINRVTSAETVLEESIALASQLANETSPASMATIKRQVLTQPQMSLVDAMAESDELMYESLRGADVIEGFESFLEKRPVKFAPLGQGTRFSWMDAEDSAGS